MTAQQPQGAPNTTGSVPGDGPDPYGATQGENVTEPKRIQRKRSKGWRMPAGAVYVGRGSKWGNPARIGRWASVGPDWRAGDRCTMSTYIRTNRDAAIYFKIAVKDGGLVIEDGDGARRATPVPPVDEIRADLAGKDLACWCPLGEPCHADVLLRLANATNPSTLETAP